jgi:quercetin dioxygenase-like cupin family protein
MSLEVLYGRGGELEQYADRVSRLQLSDLLSHAQVTDYGDLAIATVHKRGRFQVEMVSIRSGVSIPSHTHPSMASIEFPIMGCVRFVVGGREDEFALWSDKAHARLAKGRGVRIGAGEIHRGRSGPASVFLSIQEWSRKPDSAMLDWVGAPLTGEHREALHAAVA